MKIVALIVLTGIGAASVANASQALNCLQWRLKVDSRFVGAAAARAVATSVIENGREFGFYNDDSSEGNRYEYYFRYDRESIVDHPGRVTRYEEFLESLSWHLGSRRGYQFECSFWAGGPQPRISGSN